MTGVQTCALPIYPPINAGGACGDGTQMCDDMGRCLSCFDASDCEGGTFCSPMACIAGACVPTPLPPGTPLEDDQQTDGDCHRTQCNATGEPEVVVDNTDLPGSTSNECVEPSCTDGVPGTFPLPTGNSCSVGGTHWDELAAKGASRELPGPKPTLFFAPAQASKRIEQWGAGGFQQRLAAAWVAFMKPVTNAQTPWLKVVSGNGRQAVETVYRELLDGRTAPQDGHVMSLAA